MTGEQDGDKTKQAVPMQIEKGVDFSTWSWNSRVLRVKPEQAGSRLDAVLEELFPEYGLRGRRRRWGWCRVTVDGKARKCSFRVKPGEEVAVIRNNSAPAPSLFNPEIAAEALDALSARQSAFPGESPAGRTGAGGRESIQDYKALIVTANEDFAAFGKSGGIASASLAGGGRANIEDILERNWPELWKFYAGRQKSPSGAVPPKPLLCNRLDAETSGLLTAAFSAEKVADFRLYERAGKVKKKYLALVHGAAPEYLLMDKMLDTYRRRSTLVLLRQDPDYTRHTKAVLLKTFRPESASGRERPCLAEQEAAGGQDWKSALSYLIGLTGPVSLLEVTILRGARHQIRAHFADAGFPLVGDSLYGLESSARAGRMFLHHFSITFPGFQARWMPDWDLSGIALADDEKFARIK
jgi:23S rRNA pseudouridine1911/1915/1917 synthase